MSASMSAGPTASERQGDDLEDGMPPLGDPIRQRIASSVSSCSNSPALVFGSQHIQSASQHQASASASARSPSSFSLSESVKTGQTISNSFSSSPPELDSTVAAVSNTLQIQDVVNKLGSSMPFRASRDAVLSRADMTSKLSSITSRDLDSRFSDPSVDPNSPVFEAAVEQLTITDDPAHLDSPPPLSWVLNKVNLASLGLPASQHDLLLAQLSKVLSEKEAEIEAANKRAEAANKRAEAANALADRKTSLKECKMFHDSVLLDVMATRACPNNYLPIANLNGNRLMPHRLRPDVKMADQVHRMGELVQEALGDDQAVPLLLHTIQYLRAKMEEKERFCSENEAMVLWLDLLPAVNAAILALASKMANLNNGIYQSSDDRQPRLTNQSDLVVDHSLQEIASMFPGIPWSELEGSLKLDLQARDILPKSKSQKSESDHEARRPPTRSNASSCRGSSNCRRSKKTHPSSGGHLETIGKNEVLGSFGLDHTQAVGERDPSQKPNEPPKVVEVSGSSQSQLTTESSLARLHSDIFCTLRLQSQKPITFQLAEIKALHQGNSVKLQNFFAHPTLIRSRKSSRQTANPAQKQSSTPPRGNETRDSEAEAATSKEALLQHDVLDDNVGKGEEDVDQDEEVDEDRDDVGGSEEVGEEGEVGQAFKDIDIAKLARQRRGDRQALGAISQSFSFIARHRCPFVFLSAGSTNVFFHYDHKRRSASPQKSVDLDYFVVTNSTEEHTWKPRSLFDCLVYSTLRGLSHAVQTTSQDRQLWYEEAIQHTATVYDLGILKRPRQDAKKKGNPSSSETQDESAGETFDRESEREDRDDQGSSGNTDGADKPDASGGSDNLNSRDAFGGTEGANREGDSGITGPEGQGPKGGTRQNNRSLAETSQQQRADLSGVSPACEVGSHKGSNDSALSTRRNEDHDASSLSSPPSSRPSSTCASSARSHIFHFSSHDDREWDGTPRYALRHPNLITNQWCSTLCLFSLKFGLRMDPDCPNVHLHCRKPGCTDHASHPHWFGVDEIKKAMHLKLRYGHIVRTMEPILGCDGSTAQLFRFFHPTLGYAFAAKGVNDENEHLLVQEHAIYEHLWSKAPPLARGQEQQSSPIGHIFPAFEVTTNERGDRVALHIPMCFGIVKPKEYYIDIMYPLWPHKGQVEVGYAYNTFLLLSYHGLSLFRQRARHQAFEHLPAWHKEGDNLLDWCDDVLWRHSVEHRDLGWRNVLWSEELRAVMVIDFAEASILNIEAGGDNGEPSEDGASFSSHNEHDPQVPEECSAQILERIRGEGPAQALVKAMGDVNGESSRCKDGSREPVVLKRSGSNIDAVEQIFSP